MGEHGLHIVAQRGDVQEPTEYPKEHGNATIQNPTAIPISRSTWRTECQ